MSEVKVVFRDQEWFMYRQGYFDQKRHQEKIKEALRQNLVDIVSEESIIMADGSKIIRVPVRSLEEYGFRFNANKQTHLGHGQGNSKMGDIIKKNNSGGNAGGPGCEPGIDYYEAEITVDELAEIIFADLGLPNLRPLPKEEGAKREDYYFRDVRARGIMSNLDRKRTLLQSLRRCALSGKCWDGKIQLEDLRFRCCEEQEKPGTRAVVLAMMDTSGSMGPFEKYIARSFFFWMVRFLRTRYEDVEVVFLIHHTHAKEVTEEEFFTRGESGGTVCSSVYELALDIIEKRYPPGEFNIYAFHFSDGDNLPRDNERCLELMNRLIALCNMVGYGEIEGTFHNYSSLMALYQKIEHPSFVKVTIRDKSDVYPALRKFFGLQGVRER